MREPHHPDRWWRPVRWPHDRDAERAVLGNSLRSAAWHDRARALVGAGDFYFTEHQVLFQAIDDLDDVGPFTRQGPLDYDWWRAAWPLTVPSSLGVRVGALSVLGPYGAPLWALDRLAQAATGRVEADARTVAARAAERREIQSHLDRVAELAGTRR